MSKLDFETCPACGHWNSELCVHCGYMPWDTYGPESTKESMAYGHRVLKIRATGYNGRL